MSKLNDKKMIDDIRSLALDMIHEAGSGHPGIALGAAPIIFSTYVNHMKNIWKRHLCHMNEWGSRYEVHIINITIIRIIIINIVY